MHRPRALQLCLCAALSLGLHAAGLAGALRTAPPPTPPAFEPTSRGLVGEAMDVEPAEPAAVEEVEAETTPAPALAEPGPGPSSTSARRPSAARRGPASPAASGAPGAVATMPAVYGAVGVRYATDLATTFTRGFPQAASADPVWITAPLGAAGTAEVTLGLDESGHLTSSAITGAPSAALRRGIERTLVLLGGRTFTARGATTRLRVVARVSRDEVHDGLHGEVFALSGGSFAHDVGSAFFTLPASGGPGRRVDVELRLVP